MGPKGMRVTDARGVRLTAIHSVEQLSEVLK